MSKTKQAPLLRELVEEIVRLEGVLTCYGANVIARRELINRAREAAEELEDRKVPELDDIGRIIAAMPSSRSAARVLLARFDMLEI